MIEHMEKQIENNKQLMKEVLDKYLEQCKNKNNENNDNDHNDNDHNNNQKDNEGDDIEKKELMEKEIAVKITKRPNKAKTDLKNEISDDELVKNKKVTGLAKNNMQDDDLSMNNSNCKKDLKKASNVKESNDKESNDEESDDKKKKVIQLKKIPKNSPKPDRMLRFRRVNN